jgi:signal transduction histidine kinase/DNA-binding response OmpR family regulator
VVTTGEQAINILIVDDRASQRQALGLVVRDLGANIHEAGSGREALRLLLDHDYAVILLDVNMPGMDGFETASIIRQRARSEHTPIIFVTAYGDESHAARGYLLGAVDYIQSPVDTHVLRSKVSVFVELSRKTSEATRLADSLRRRVDQQRRLAELSLAVHEARSVDALLEAVAAAATGVVDAEQVCIETRVEPTAAFARHEEEAGVHFVVRRPPHRPFDVPEGYDHFEGRQALRFGVAELAAHPQFSELASERRADGLRGWLAVPLRGRDGHVNGAIHLTGRRDGEFDQDDEGAVAQVAQIASIAIENLLFKDAAEANRLKDQFLATLSHELRTPLQAMLSWARILQEDASDPDVRTRGIDVIKRSAVAQKQLIDDLLDVSRIVAGKLRLEPQLISLETVAQEALESVRHSAEGKGISLGAMIGAQGVAVYGDPHRLQQVIENLLSNAVKFTPKGGQVRLLLADDGQRAEIRVIDSGEGIAPEFLPHVFERFRQADSSSTRSHTGLGIGLAIVRHLVELHGGSVRAESEGKGLGATFIVEIPLARRTALAVVDDGRPSFKVTGDAFTSLRGLRILLVDDVDDARECVALLLRRRGAEVTSVASANEALRVLRSARPHVLVSDIAMPGRDGISLIEEIRESAGVRIPAAALSAYARPEERERALRAGFDIHLAKPVREETLVANVAALARLAVVEA